MYIHIYIYIYTYIHIYIYTYIYIYIYIRGAPRRGARPGQSAGGRAPHKAREDSCCISKRNANS